MDVDTGCCFFTQIEHSMSRFPKYVAGGKAFFKCKFVIKMSLSQTCQDLCLCLPISSDMKPLILNGINGADKMCIYSVFAFDIKKASLFPRFKFHRFVHELLYLFMVKM